MPVYLLDARNHGRSFHRAPHDYLSMAQDVLRVMEQENLTKICLLGHSMGGKTAMYVATEAAFRVDKLVVADMSPRAYTSDPLTSLTQKGLRALKEVVEAKCTSRKEAEQLLEQQITEASMRLFLMKNLTRSDTGLVCKANLSLLIKSLPILSKALPPGRGFNKPTLFLKGEQSDYIAAADLPLIKHHFPKAKLHVIKQAGHWLHAQQPRVFSQQVLNFLADEAEE